MRGAALLAPVQPAYALPRQPDPVPFVLGEVVGQPGPRGVHGGPAQRLVVGHLAGGHPHQRRPGEVHRPVPDHDHLVGHSRHVRAARRGVAEHHADRGDPRRGEPGQVAEHPPARDEDLRLGRQVGTGRLDQVDHGQAVRQRDLTGPPRLRERPRVHGAAAHRRVVRDDQALDALDHTDAGHHARPDREVGAVRRHRRQLQERAVRVEQQFDPLAGKELAARVVPGHVLLAAPGPRPVQRGVQLREPLQQRRPVLGEPRRGWVDPAPQHRHSGPSVRDRPARGPGSLLALTAPCPSR